MSLSSTASTSKRRPGLFAPARPPSSASIRSTTASSSTSIPSRSTTPINAAPPRKIKASVTADARPRSPTKMVPTSRPPSRYSGAISNHSHPMTPRRGGFAPVTRRIDTSGDHYVAGSSFAPTSPDSEEAEVEMLLDEDPERGLVDFQSIEAEMDQSGEWDPRRISELVGNTEDKVLVSIRIRPSGPHDNQAWDIDHDDCSLKVKDAFARSATAPQVFKFDNILTGSENKAVYKAAAQGHVRAAMEGFNAVIFAYGQTASGKTFTLTGNDDSPGIIPRAMRDVFRFIRATSTREYLLRASYLEIYNEQIVDLLCPSGARVPVAIQGIHPNTILHPLREEVITSLKGVKDVIERGESNRRTASTDWNERSSRSHSVFRLVIESRERSDEHAPSPRVPLTPGGARLQAKGGRSVQTSVLSLIDLAGSEKATSDKERTKEGKYINTSLLTLGTVIGTLAENASKGTNGKMDHVPYRNSKLTRMLQPSLSGDARISVICTLNPTTGAVGESTSTLGFASRVKRVALNATKKEIIDNDALIERYRKEIEELKQKLAERDEERPTKGRRLSAREKEDESRDKLDLSQRLKQLSKLILTSQTVGDVGAGDETRPSSPNKLDFDLSPYELQQKLLSALAMVDVQSNQIFSLEATLSTRPTLPSDAPESEKDRLIAELTKANRELEIVVRGYEENLGKPLRAVKEDVEREWEGKLHEEQEKREESERWANELVTQLEKEKQARTKLEEEKLALIAFVTDIDPVLRRLDSAPSSSSLPRSISSNSSTRKRPALGDVSSAATPAPLASIVEDSPIKSMPGFMDSPIKRVPAFLGSPTRRMPEFLDSPVKMDMSKLRGEMSLLHEVVDETAGMSPIKGGSSPLRAPFTPVRARSPFRLVPVSPTKNSAGVLIGADDKENISFDFNPHRLFT